MRFPTFKWLQSSTQSAPYVPDKTHVMEDKNKKRHVWRKWLNKKEQKGASEPVENQQPLGEQEEVALVPIILLFQYDP